MKSKQIMIREDFIQQRTDNGYFNATLVLNNWNNNNEKNKKLMTEYLKLKNTNEFIEYLKSNEKIEKPSLVSTKGSWMHPLLFVDFCMWISLEFKTMALKYVLDGLINTRHSAGDYYNQMCAVIMDRYIEYNGCKPSPMIYINEANMIKEIANVNCDRNEMSESQLNKITILQKVNSTLITEKVGKESRRKQLEIISRSL